MAGWAGRLSLSKSDFEILILFFWVFGARGRQIKKIKCLIKV